MRGTARGIAAALLAIGLPAAHAQGIGSCPPPALSLTAHRLAHVAAGLQPGQQLDVLALGSASLLGPQGGTAGSVPDEMVQALHARMPTAVIRLTLRAERADSAAEMLDTLTRELAAHRFQLVLWQTGTVEALRRLPPEPFRRTLAAGIAAATAAGADVVLIDMQFSRLLDRHADLDPYRAAMTEMALQPGVMLFPRYALMRGWAESGAIDLEGSARRDRRQTLARLRFCLGAALANQLGDAAAASGPPS
jgi:acyl-CoA thioesterase-1